MKTRIPTVGLALALPLLLSLYPASLAGQANRGPAWSQQDTAATQDSAPLRRGRCPHCGAWMEGRGGAGLGLGMARGPGDHIGPRMLVGLRDELDLENEQVERLEQLMEEHHAAQQARAQRLRDLSESLRRARTEGDWDSLEDGIDEAAGLRAAMAKGHLQIERQSLEVLSDEQREKLETWREGHRLFRRGRGMPGAARMMRGRGMRGRGLYRSGAARRYLFRR